MYDLFGLQITGISDCNIPSTNSGLLLNNCICLVLDGLTAILDKLCSNSTIHLQELIRWVDDGISCFFDYVTLHNLYENWTVCMTTDQIDLA